MATSKKTILSEGDFNTKYRKAKPEYYKTGLVWYHRNQIAPDQFEAVKANIHDNEDLSSSQFDADALSGIAYLPASEIPAANEDVRPVDAIMKGGKLVETASKEDVKNAQAGKLNTTSSDGGSKNSGSKSSSKSASKSASKSGSKKASTKK